MSKENSNWGGRRSGAGRKPGEKTKRISVPEGCLDAVKAVIEEHRALAARFSENVRVAPAAIVSEKRAAKAGRNPRIGNTGIRGVHMEKN